MDRILAYTFEYSPIGLGLVSIDGDWIRVNPALLQILGYTDQELSRQNFKDLCHPDDLRELYRIYQVLISGKKNTCGIEKRMIHRDGYYVWVQLHVILVRKEDGTPLYFLAQFQDITEKKRLKQKLESSETMYRLIAENTSDLVGILDTSLTILYASPSHEKVLGNVYTEGKDARVFFYPEEIPLVNKELEILLKHKITRRFETRIPDQEGNTLFVEIQASPILNEEGEVQLIQYSTRDITEKKRADEILIENENLYRNLYEGMRSISRESKTVLKKQDLLEALARIVGRIFKTSEVGVVTAYPDGTLQFTHPDWKINLPKELLFSTDKILLFHQDVIFLKVSGSKHHKNYFIAVKNTYYSSVPVALIQGLMTISHFSEIITLNIDQIEDILSELQQALAEKRGPAWLSRLLFKVAEQQRQKLSIDLHDTALQEQLIWYRKLAEFINEVSLPESSLNELKRIQKGFEDVIYQIRITCNELTPPFLKKLGIIKALESLFHETRIRIGAYQIHFNHQGNFEELNHDQVLGIYRIVQELLSNATKHSKATKVEFTLINGQQELTLSYADNGIGIEEKVFYGTSTQIGLYGIQERVRSLEGTCTFHSPDSGLMVEIRLPVRVDWNEENITIG